MCLGMLNISPTGDDNWPSPGGCLNRASCSAFAKRIKSFAKILRLLEPLRYLDDIWMIFGWCLDDILLCQSFSKVTYRSRRSMNIHHAGICSVRCANFQKMLFSAQLPLPPRSQHGIGRALGVALFLFQDTLKPPSCKWSIWGVPEIGVPVFIIQFNGIFPCRPSISGYPHLWKPPLTLW